MLAHLTINRCAKLTRAGDKSSTGGSVSYLDCRRGIVLDQAIEYLPVEQHVQK
jgi:hypothetical protein